MPILSGRFLKQLYDTYLCPFDKNGNLKNEAERKTLLASNINYPAEIQAKAFVIASAEGEGSPQIVQCSYTCSKMTGNLINSIDVLPGVTYRGHARPTGAGSLRTRQIIDW